MPGIGSDQCDGCNECLTPTVAADDTAHDWPCCENFPDNIAPCRYAVIARCTIVVDTDAVVSDCLYNGPVGQVLLLWAVTELRKACYVGCDWKFAPTCVNGAADDAMMLLDVIPNAINPSFPPVHNTPLLGHHDADYRSGTPNCLAPSSCYGNFDINCEETNVGRWRLSAGGTAPGDVTFTLVAQDVLTWAAGLGKVTPYYENVDEWQPFGRNRMDIVAGYDDWPMLPKSICVVALDDPGAQDNPCDTQEHRCACNDFTMGDTITLLLMITGCSGISGLVNVGMTRYTSPDPLPCGVSYPTPNPCGVFIGSLSTGPGCSFGGVSWSGGVLLMIWCDGDTYNGKVYCYSNDSSCYVEQGAISITRLDRLCWGVIYLELTLPDIDCCCPELPPCSCAPSGTPTPSIYTDITSTCGASFESTSTVELLPTITGCWEASGAGTGGLPSGIDIVNVCCAGDVWTCTLTFLSAACGSPSSVAASGTCSPFGVEFVFTLDATCCPPGGGTVTVTVME